MIQGRGGNDVCRISRIDRFAGEDIRDIGKLPEIDGTYVVGGFDAAQDQGLEDLVQAAAVIRNGGASDIGGEVDAHSTRRPREVVGAPVPLPSGQLVGNQQGTHGFCGRGACIQCDALSDGGIRAADDTVGASTGDYGRKARVKARISLVIKGTTSVSTRRCGWWERGNDDEGEVEAGKHCQEAEHADSWL